MIEQIKRNVAYKLRIGDILKGKPILEEQRFKFLELGDKHIIRVNVVANVIEKYESEGEKKYISLTIDDASGQIKLKAFGIDVDRFKDTQQGSTIIVIGVLRHWNEELYISPEIIKEQEPKYLLVRKLEIEKEKPKVIDKQEIKALKDQIIDIIKRAEENGGIETERLILDLNAAPELITQEVQKLLEEGLAYEPRPGKIRYLG